jgi:hypothetical protein
MIQTASWLLPKLPTFSHDRRRYASGHVSKAFRVVGCSTFQGGTLLERFFCLAS